MLVVIVTGPNGSGKTTAVDRAVAPWRFDRRITVVHGDHQPEFHGEVGQVRASVASQIESGADVVVFESTDRVTRAVALSDRSGIDCVAFVTETEPDAMRARLRRRCLQRGKPYRDDYWDLKRLLYEGTRRYRNLMIDKFPDVPVRYFQIGPDHEG
jgi:ribose 1,5-bisphosphokinase PhnN